MTEPPVLQDLVDDAAFLSHEHQLHLSDLHGDDAWNVDLSTGTFVFTAGSGETTECRVQFLGTSAPGPGSWMWGWHNVNGFPDDVLRAAEGTRATGLAEATTAELSLDDELPHRLTLAAKVSSGSYTHYSAPVGGGTRAWLLVEHPSLDLPRPAVPRVVRTLSEGLLSVTVVDHRRAVLAYAAARGLDVQGEDGTVRLVLPDGAVTVVFDAAGRIAGIQARSGPSRADGGETAERADPADGVGVGESADGAEPAGVGDPSDVADRAEPADAAEAAEPGEATTPASPAGDVRVPEAEEPVEAPTTADEPVDGERAGADGGVVGADGDVVGADGSAGAEDDAAPVEESRAASGQVAGAAGEARPDEPPRRRWFRRRG